MSDDATSVYASSVYTPLHHNQLTPFNSHQSMMDDDDFSPTKQTLYSDCGSDHQYSDCGSDHHSVHSMMDEGNLSPTKSMHGFESEGLTDPDLDSNPFDLSTENTFCGYTTLDLQDYSYGYEPIQPKQVLNNSEWKKWNVVKLREKLNYLGKNDQGKRPVLVARLSEYYDTLPTKISQSDNPWVNDNFEINRSEFVDFELESEPTLHDQLLIHIVDILQVMSDDFILQKQNQQQQQQQQQRQQQQQ